MRALTVRAHVPAQVAAVLEDLAAGATLMDAFMLTQLTDELPPDTMSAGQNQAPLEGNGAAWMMREPAQERDSRSRRGGGWVLIKFPITVTSESSSATFPSYDWSMRKGRRNLEPPSPG